MTKEEFKKAGFRPSEVIDGLNGYFEDKTKSLRFGNKFTANSNCFKREVVDLAIAWLRSLGIFYVPNMVLPRYELTEEVCIAEYGCSCIRDMWPTTIAYCRNDVVCCEERKLREDLEKEVMRLYDLVSTPYLNKRFGDDGPSVEEALDILRDQIGGQKESIAQLIKMRDTEKKINDRLERENRLLREAIGDCEDNFKRACKMVMY